MLLLASGRQAHGTVILLHGSPGYEQNMDLAQALRRDGWNVLAMHYRGSWGSEGIFSFTNCMEDVGTMLAHVSEPANNAKFHADLRRIVVIGHLYGWIHACRCSGSTSPDCSRSCHHRGQPRFGWSRLLR